MPAGRPTEYQDHYPEKAYEFCLEFAFTDKKLARLFDVSEVTICAWKKEYPEFLKSIRDGKDDHDSNRIEKSLARRAQGFKYTETTKELSDTPDPQTGNGKMVTTKTVRKQVAPDTKAIEFWLRNRKSKRWPDRKSVGIGGEDGGPAVIAFMPPPPKTVEEWLKAKELIDKEAQRLKAQAMQAEGK